MKRQHEVDSATAPGHTDLMVTPESLDAWLEANPLPIDRKTRKARLERAGYEWAEGWFPVAFARRVRSQANAHRSEVERICAEPAKPRGRPRKEEKTDA